MLDNVKTIEEYLDGISEDKRFSMIQLRKTILENLPDGFSETMQYGMPTYVVPHSIYPKGYHCNPKDQLPFLSFAAQKNFISLYHLALYMDKELFDWFIAEYPKHCKTKLDMGKSCVRFKKPNDIPFDLIAELCRKITVEQWIAHYEAQLNAK